MVWCAGVVSGCLFILISIHGKDFAFKQHAPIRCFKDGPHRQTGQTDQTSVCVCVCGVRGVCVCVCVCECVCVCVCACACACACVCCVCAGVVSGCLFILISIYGKGFAFKQHAPIRCFKDGPHRQTGQTGQTSV